MTNILKFPSVSELPMNNEEMLDRLFSTREAYATEIAEEAFEMVMSLAHNAGLMTNPDKMNGKDTVALYEMLRSIFMRYSGLHHAFQDVVDQIIQEDDEIPEITSEEIPDLNHPAEI